MNLVTWIVKRGWLPPETEGPIRSGQVWIYVPWNLRWGKRQGRYLVTIVRVTDDAVWVSQIPGPKFQNVALPAAEFRKLYRLVPDVVAKLTPVPDRPVDLSDAYLTDMLRAVDAGARLSALALALALPDICSSIAYPDIHEVGERYRRWCDEWGQILAVSGADCYALRCAYLHSGQEEFSGPAARRALFSRIEFTIGQTSGGWSSTARPGALFLGAKQIARLPIEIFCRDMAGSVIGWRRKQTDQGVLDGIAELLWMRPVEP